MIGSRAKKISALLAPFAFLLLSATTARAQSISPEFLVTWKAAGTYIPSFYQDKALPTYGSNITASLELVSGGKILNLKQQTIYWYLNDTLIGGGTGIQKVTFPPFGEPPTLLTLKVELPSYNGNFLVHAIQIPMIQPEAVIYAPYPGGDVSESPVTLKALPYFFNVSSPDNLSFSWSVNGQAGSNAENPDEAQINLPANTPAGTIFAASLTIQNPSDSTNGTASTNLIYQPQL
jgi:hypothetical protein